MTEDKKIFYLGVEGGATKSTAILADDDLNVIAERMGKALNYHSLHKSLTERNFKDLLDPLIKLSDEGMLLTVFGLAGADTPKDEIFYKNVARRILPKNSRFAVLNDTKIALEAKCPSKGSRIIVIAGTGSNVYGESSSGEMYRVIGWDFILGDQGSGYYFGLKVLEATTKSRDGIIVKTLLEDLAYEFKKVKVFNNFLPKVYNELSDKKTAESFKQFISSFAPLIDRAIERGDKEAIRIRDEGAAELALGVYTVAKKLGFDKKKFCLGVIGSQWKMPGLFETFKKEVLKQCPKAWFSENENSGAWGAVLMAKGLNVIKA